MTLENLLAIHRLQLFEATPEGVQKLLASAERNLADARLPGLGPDNSFDAAYKAIEKMLGSGGVLTEYTVHAVTEGNDAQGEAVVKLKGDGKPVTGRGLSTDVIEASILAYLNAAQKLETLRGVDVKNVS